MSETVHRKLFSIGSLPLMICCLYHATSLDMCSFPMIPIWSQYEGKSQKNECIINCLSTPKNYILLLDKPVSCLFLDIWKMLPGDLRNDDGHASVMPLISTFSPALFTCSHLFLYALLSVSCTLLHPVLRGTSAGAMVKVEVLMPPGLYVSFIAYSCSINPQPFVVPKWLSAPFKASLVVSSTKSDSQSCHRLLLPNNTNSV